MEELITPRERDELHGMAALLTPSSYMRKLIEKALAQIKHDHPFPPVEVR